MPRRLLARSSLLSLLLGCAHAGGAPEARDETSSQACNAGGERAATREQTALYDLSFRVRTDGERGSWTTPGRELHSFSLGPWECALGPEQALDQAGAEGVRLERARRLACTHRSGATVQTELRCSVPEPATVTAASALRRELAVALSAAPELSLACELGPVERLEIRRAAPAEAAAFCLLGQSLAPCPNTSEAVAPRAEQTAR